MIDSESIINYYSIYLINFSNKIMPLLLLAFFFVLLLAPASGRGEDCLSSGCHQELGSGAGMHAPVAAGNCRACHLPHSTAAPRLLLVKEVPELCLDCHDTISTRMQQAKSRHAPLYRKRSCLGCHAVHASPYPRLLSKSQPELCLACHGLDDFSKSKTLRNIGTEMRENKLLHAPLVRGDCTACHTPHGSDYYRLLNAAYPGGVYAKYQPDIYAFCFQCHDGKLLQSPTGADATRFRNGTRNLHFLHVVAPVKGHTCQSCHAPHAGGERLLLNAEGVSFGSWRIPLQVELTPSGGRCASGCHLPVKYDRENPQKYP